MIVTLLLLALAILQTAWCLVYGTGPWRATRLGWVWLLKGSLIALVWWLLWYDRRYHDVPDVVWVALGVGLLVATSAWLVATIRARRGDL
jgi:hypothetical protein